MERNDHGFEVRINVDLYIKVRAQAGNDAEYTAIQILTDKLLNSDVVYRIDPMVITTTPITEPLPEGTDDVKH